MEGERARAEDQMRMKWESLHQEFSAKQKLLQNALEQEQDQVVSMFRFSTLTVTRDAQLC